LFLAEAIESHIFPKPFAVFFPEQRLLSAPRDESAGPPHHFDRSDVAAVDAVLREVFGIGQEWGTEWWCDAQA
jgi:hypothetical protein